MLLKCVCIFVVCGFLVQALPTEQIDESDDLKSLTINNDDLNNSIPDKKNSEIETISLSEIIADINDDQTNIDNLINEKDGNINSILDNYTDENEMTPLIPISKNECETNEEKMNMETLNPNTNEDNNDCILNKGTDENEMTPLIPVCESESEPNEEETNMETLKPNTNKDNNDCILNKGTDENEMTPLIPVCESESEPNEEEINMETLKPNTNEDNNDCIPNTGTDKNEMTPLIPVCENESEPNEEQMNMETVKPNTNEDNNDSISNKGTDENEIAPIVPGTKNEIENKKEQMKLENENNDNIPDNEMEPKNADNESETNIDEDQNVINSDCSEIKKNEVKNDCVSNQNTNDVCDDDIDSNKAEMTPTNVPSGNECDTNKKQISDVQDCDSSASNLVILKQALPVIVGEIDFDGILPAVGAVTIKGHSNCPPPFPCGNTEEIENNDDDSSSCDNTADTLEEEIPECMDIVEEDPIESVVNDKMNIAELDMEDLISSVDIAADDACTLAETDISKLDDHIESVIEEKMALVEKSLSDTDKILSDGNTKCMDSNDELQFGDNDCGLKKTCADSLAGEDIIQAVVDDKLDDAEAATEETVSIVDMTADEVCDLVECDIAKMEKQIEAAVDEKLTLVEKSIKETTELVDKAVAKALLSLPDSELSTVMGLILKNRTIPIETAVAITIALAQLSLKDAVETSAQESKKPIITETQCGSDDVIIIINNGCDLIASKINEVECQLKKAIALADKILAKSLFAKVNQIINAVKQKMATTEAVIHQTTCAVDATACKACTIVESEIAKMEKHIENVVNEKLAIAEQAIQQTTSIVDMAACKACALVESEIAKMEKRVENIVEEKLAVVEKAIDETAGLVGLDQSKNPTCVDSIGMRPEDIDAAITAMTALVESALEDAMEEAEVEGLEMVPMTKEIEFGADAPYFNNIGNCGCNPLFPLRNMIRPPLAMNANPLLERKPVQNYNNGYFCGNQNLGTGYTPLPLMYLPQVRLQDNGCRNGVFEFNGNAPAFGKSKVYAHFDCAPLEPTVVGPDGKKYIWLAQ